MGKDTLKGAVSTTQAVSVWVLAEFETSSSALEASERITVYFYLQAGHEGNVGVNILPKKTGAAQMRVTPQ